MNYVLIFAAQFTKRPRIMGVTRLKRKGRRNKQTAKARVARIKSLQYQPVLKNVDADELKAQFEAEAPKKEVKAEKPEAPKAEQKETSQKEEKPKAEKKSSPKAKKEAKPKAAEEKAEKKDDAAAEGEA